jgi:EEF1A lysine methyltransferase 4
MKSKYSDLQARWGVMDVRELRLSDSSVDVAIDKSTLDAMLHGSLWNPPVDVRSSVGRYVDEVKRLFLTYTAITNCT